MFTMPTSHYDDVREAMTSIPHTFTKVAKLLFGAFQLDDVRRALWKGTQAMADHLGNKAKLRQELWQLLRERDVMHLGEICCE